MKYSGLIYLLICLRCISHPVTPPIFEVSYLQGKKGEIKVTSTTTKSVIEISSEFGIGGGAVKLIDGSWPEILIVRLHLKGLEGFTVSNGKMEIDKSDLLVQAYDKNGNTFEHKYLMDKKGYYEVLLPGSLFAEGTSEIKIHWVDFYR